MTGNADEVRDPLEDIGRTADPIRRLDLRIDVDDASPNDPTVTIPIDGEDQLGRGGELIAFDPEEILDSAALVPRDPPRRVAVYRCNCGEPGCGCVAPVISRQDHLVVWSDIRELTGVYARPLIDRNPSGGARLDVPKLIFDEAQYRAAVVRATADRSWESPARQAARLLREHPRDADGELTRLGYWRGWVAPRWNVGGKFDVEFVGPDGQIIVSLRPTASEPVEQPAEMARTLLATPPEDWRVTTENDRDTKTVRAATQHRAAMRR